MARVVVRRECILLRPGLQVLFSEVDRDLPVHEVRSDAVLLHDSSVSRHHGLQHRHAHEFGVIFLAPAGPGDALDIFKGIHALTNNSAHISSYKWRLFVYQAKLERREWQADIEEPSDYITALAGAIVGCDTSKQEELYVATVVGGETTVRTTRTVFFTLQFPPEIVLFFNPEPDFFVKNNNEHTQQPTE